MIPGAKGLQTQERHGFFMLMKFIGGFCMALADSVPGVSGGTIAFLLGFYDEFINSLNDLVYGTWEERKRALFFLIKLGIGWIAGFGMAVLILTTVFESHIYQVSSLFMGFIICSIPIVLREEKTVVFGKYGNLIFTMLGIAVVSLITYYNPVAGEGNRVDISHLNIGLIAYIFIAAMIAISAMVLPGISGSTLLLIFGLYLPILEAIKELMSFHMEAFPIVFIFGLGILAGVVVVIKLVKVALEKFRSQTVYTIIGLMLGSLYAIAMGPATLEVPKPAMSLATFDVLFFVIGAMVIIGMQFLRKFANK